MLYSVTFHVDERRSEGIWDQITKRCEKACDAGSEQGIHCNTIALNREVLAERESTLWVQERKHEANVGGKSKHLCSNTALRKKDDECEHQEIYPAKDRSSAGW